MTHIVHNWGWRERLARYLLALKHLGLIAFLQRRKASRIGNTNIRPRASDHPLFVRASTSDIYVFEQIFVEREYRCLDGLRGIETIVDAGANVGFASAYFLSRFKRSKVIAIEPDDQNIRSLKRNLFGWKERAVVVEGAVWSESCMLDLRDDVEAEAWARQVHKVTDGRVPAYDMPTILDRYGIERLDLLKMDIEGAELNVFGASDLSWLKRVRNIVIELHGEECEKVFFSAVKDHGFTISRCDELIVCLEQA